MNGKILILFLLVINLFAVSAKVDKQNVIEGDNVVFSITASGGHIEFPNITNIDGDKIEGISTSQSISIINGNYKKSVTKSYAFTPSHSLTIPKFEVIVDNKKEYTKPIKIKVVKDTKTDKDFKLEIKTKKTAVVGYPNIVTIYFYQKTNVKISSIALELPKGDFELKQVGKEEDFYKGVYQVAKINYFLIPKKEGKLSFKVRLKLGFMTQRVDAFGFIANGMRYKTIQKVVNINVSKLGNGIIGDYKINLSVDKTKVEANKPVNAKLTIQGEGDLLNLGDIKIDIPNATVYDNKAKIDTKIINNKLYSKYSKSFVIVADSNYTIPPLSFSFYDITNDTNKTIMTKPINIEVKSSNQAVVLSKNINPQKVITKIEYKTNYLYIILTFIVGIIIGYLISKLNLKKVSLPQNLYQKLLPYADNAEVKKILNKLYNKEKLSKEEKEFIKGFLNENKRSDKIRK